MEPLQQILSEVESVLRGFDHVIVERVVQALGTSNGRIFVVGEGRSGLMGKAFAMRLMHLGAQVYVVGETITPSIQGADLLVAISGSGTTQSVVEKAEKAKQLGCVVIAVTTNPASPLAAASDVMVHIPAATKYRTAGESVSAQPLGSLFDQTVHIVLDAVCLCYAQNHRQSNLEAVQRHANLE